MSTKLAAFSWETTATTVSYVLDGSKKQKKLVCRLTASQPGVRYISLGNDNRTLHLRLDRVLECIGDKTSETCLNDHEKKFLKDVKKFKSDVATRLAPPLDMWSEEGVPMTVKLFETTKVREVKFVKAAHVMRKMLGTQVLRDEITVKQAGRQYGYYWAGILADAANYSGNMTKQNVTKFNMKNRFCSIPEVHSIRPLKLFVVSKDEDTWLTLDGMKVACDNVFKKMDEENKKIATVTWQAWKNEGQVTPPKDPPQCRFIVAKASDVENAGDLLIHISTHPLGFYNTYVLKADLGNLVDIQVGGKGNSWNYPLADASQVQSLHKVLINLLGGSFKKKMSQVRPYTTSMVPLEKGKVIDRHARLQTQNIMGRSANKWAPTFGWKKTGDTTVMAEWLHREAHRFSGACADVFPNLIFGSKECNTNMIRVEDMVNQFLDDDTKVHKVVIQTMVDNVDQVSHLQRDGTLAFHQVPWYNKAETPGKYYYWAAAELHYVVTVRFNNGGFIWHENIYQPYHRYYPLRYEIELDQILLKNHFLPSIQAAPKPPS